MNTTSRPPSGSSSSSDERKNPPQPCNSTPSSSSEDSGSGSGSDGGADDGGNSSSSSCSSSAARVVALANHRSVIDEEIQKSQPGEQPTEDVVVDSFDKLVGANTSDVDQQHPATDEKPNVLRFNNYKDYSHEFPTTESELYLQQTGVVYCIREKNDELDAEMTTTTTSNSSSSAALVWFPLQLHEILSDMEQQQQRNDANASAGAPVTAEDNTIIMSWQPHGRSFKIHDMEKFVETILPKYFATNNETWFLQQLKEHGFHCVVGDGPDQGSYYQEKFLRGMKFLSPQIMPHNVGTGAIKTVADLGNEPVLKRYPICPPVPLQRMLRAKGFAVSVYSNSSPALVQASSFMASQKPGMALTNKPLKIMTPLDAANLKLFINGGQACFPVKLHRTLHHLAENGHDEIMSWLPHGRAFVIRDQDRFISELMPIYFERQNKFKSFSRQLHMYNFKIIQDGPDKGALRHELFLRDEPKLCLQMHRTKKEARDITITEEAEFTNPPPSASSSQTTAGPAVVTPTTKTDSAAVELMALQCMMRDQGQGCAVASSAKTKSRTKPEKAVVAAESLGGPMTQLLPPITPESLESILSTTQVRAAQNSWPLRLQRLLDKHEAEGDDQIISWLPHGRAFTVHKPDKFISNVMPLYFRKLTKYNSFTRNLYEYSFRRCSSGPHKNVFYHSYFLRGQPREALKITRIRRNKHCKSIVPENPPATPDFFDRLALPGIAAGATIDVPVDPLAADAKHSPKRMKTTTALTTSSVGGSALDEFDIFDEDDPELGLWREVFDPANDMDV